jgi:hypothetical protein
MPRSSLPMNSINQYYICIPRLLVNFRNKIILHVEEWLAPRPTPKLEDHTLSAVRDCLFNIFAATLHIWRPLPPSATWGRAMPWWQGTHLPWHVARMGETRNAYGILVGKPEGKRPLGRPRRRWVDNIKTDLSEIGWDGVDWIELAQDRDQWRALVKTVLNLRVP